MTRSNAIDKVRDNAHEPRNTPVAARVPLLRVPGHRVRRAALRRPGAGRPAVRGAGGPPLSGARSIAGQRRRGVRAGGEVRAARRRHGHALQRRGRAARLLSRFGIRAGAP